MLSSPEHMNLKARKRGEKVMERQGIAREFAALPLEAQDQVIDSLIHKDLIAFDGHLFQVLSLPKTPSAPVRRVLKTTRDMLEKDPATVHMTLCEALGVDPDESIRQSSPGVATLPYNISEIRCPGPGFSARFLPGHFPAHITPIATFHHEK